MDKRQFQRYIIDREILTHLFEDLFCIIGNEVYCMRRRNSSRVLTSNICCGVLALCWVEVDGY